MTDSNLQIDGLFRGGVLGSPSEGLRRGLMALAEAGELLSANIGRLLQSVLGHASAAPVCLGISDLGKVETTSTTSIDVAVIVERASAIASQCGHAQVTAIHFLLAAVEQRPSDVEAALRPFADEHRRKHPQGTRRQRMLAEAAPDIGPTYLARAKALIEETPFSARRVRERLVKYLSCRYYPYGEEQWARFCVEHPRVGDFGPDFSETATALVGFLAHGFASKWADAWRKATQNDL